MPLVCEQLIVLPADKSDNEYKKVIEKISQVIAARS